MIIYINDEKFKVYPYDDKKSVFERYALKKDDALPEYFASEDFTLENKANVIIEDVRNIIKDMKETDLNDDVLIDKILAKYQIRKRTIGILWLLRHKYKKDVLSTKLNIEGPLKYLEERGVFSTLKRVELTLKDYKRDVEKRREVLKDIVDRQVELFKEYDSLENIHTTPFILEDATLSIKIKITKMTLIDIFDEINTAPNTPYVELKYKKKSYYKVSTLIEPLIEWLSEDPFTKNKPTDYIQFKILNTNVDPFTAKNKEKIYSAGLIYQISSGLYQIISNFKVSTTFTEDHFIKRLMDMFSKSVEYNILSQEQNGIRGIFRISDFNFNTAIFSDFLATNELASRIFFMDEKAQTIILKNKFYFYYSPTQNYIPGDSLGISITHDEKTKSFQFRIVRADTFLQATILQSILSKIINLYNGEYESISNIYTNLFPAEKVGAKKIKAVKDKKTKLRLGRLYTERPDIIQLGYGEQCQKPFQPYIVPEEDIKKVAKELKDPHKLILFEGSWFACEPRDKTDPKSADRNIWPGLKPNTKAPDPQYRSDVPYFPCCFKKDQYDKPRSQWRKYYDALGKEGNIKKDEDDSKSGTGYIVGIKKMCEQGRKGEMPFLWEKILKIIGIEKVSIGSYAKTEKDFYPVLRLGVVHTPDSIIHCLEYAFNSSFQIFNTKRKNERVMEIREELSKENFSIAKQNLFAESTKEIKRILLDQDAYIDPRKFVELLQKRYNCNIFLYGYDSDLFPDGEIMLPAYSQAYLAKEIIENRPTVLILMYAARYKNYPYQCELICQIDVRNNKEIKKNIKYSFGAGSKISKKAIKLFYDHNEVFIASTDKYEIYNPVSE
ncbi:MAG TPA: hypothetical protein PKD85_01425 [Saprospiraceae bacterium]|nr:hypothetical protein [Saprospiraceae bacterium]